MRKTVFIDESGDAGYKFNKGSSKILVFSAVIFDSKEESEKLNKVVRDFKLKIKLTKDRELKHNKLNKKQKIQFSEIIKTHKLNKKFLVYKKDKQNMVKDLYKITLERFLKKYENDFFEASIFIDGKQDKNFLKTFKIDISKNTKISTKDIKFLNSETNDLIQLADFIAGEEYEKNKNP